MKYVLFTFVNWITKFQEIIECSKKTIASFKRGNYNKIFFTQNSYKSFNERRNIEFW